MRAIASVTLVAPQGIRETSWLLTDKRCEWFVRGYEYACSQTTAIPVLSKCSAEELEHAVSAVIRGAGYAGFKQVRGGGLESAAQIQDKAVREACEGLK